MCLEFINKKVQSILKLLFENSVLFHIIAFIWFQAFFVPQWVFRKFHLSISGFLHYLILKIFHSYQLYSFSITHPRFLYLSLSEYEFEHKWECSQVAIYSKNFSDLFFWILNLRELQRQTIYSTRFCMRSFV